MKPDPTRRLTFAYGIITLIIVLCLAATIWYAAALWDVYRFENACAYVGAQYELGDERPDGQCVCAYGPEKWKWMWNCM